MSTQKNRTARAINLFTCGLVMLFFGALTIVVFPSYIFTNAPPVVEVTAVDGVVDLRAVIAESPESVYQPLGEWEFYPGKLYTYDDVLVGYGVEDPQVVTYPHYWKDDPMGVTGYGTYHMRFIIPEGYTRVAVMTRFQFSSSRVFIDDMLVSETGRIDENPALHQPSYESSVGTYYALNAERHDTVVDVFIQIQNEDHIKGGLSRGIYFGSDSNMQDLRMVLLLANGIISGSLLLLFLYFMFVYMHGRDKREYLDYAVVSLVSLFISLTSGGEGLLYEITRYSDFFSGELLLRLEYMVLIIGGFFANYYHLGRALRNHKRIFTALHVTVFAGMAVYLVMPTLWLTSLNAVNVFIATALFLVPLVRNTRKFIRKPSMDTTLSTISVTMIFDGMIIYMVGAYPWESIDLFSVGIILHCLLQMLIFLRRYNKIERELVSLTENLEDRIEQRTTELQQMAKKAEAATTAKSNFLATMSHEIRTPMNAILGLSDLISERNLDVVQQRYFRDIKHTSKALLQIINDILDFSKIEAGKLELVEVHFNLLAMFDNICSISYFGAVNKELSFKSDFAEDVPHVVFGDETRYRQVITNIINNAVKYTREGEVRFTVTMEGDWLVFTVTDTGIGIREEDYGRLFGTFEQLDSNTNRKIVGTGLGLSITKNLVELMGGTITFTSEYGKGSTFAIRLPYIEGDLSEIEQPEHFVTVQAAPDCRVMVVDDNSINLTVAMGFLSTHGINADTATSGREAIDKASSQKYDLIFMDHMMPEMDGIEATGHIRGLAGYADVAIVALTANAMTGSRELFLGAGMNDYLTKPIAGTHLNAILQRWLPKDKIVATEQPPVRGETGAGEIDELLAELNTIEGLDVYGALANVGYAKEAYLQILRQYCGELDQFIRDMWTYLYEESWQNYTIKLHALKGVFANIGVQKLSEWAFLLEQASRGGSYDLCRMQTELLGDAMLRFRAQLMATRLVEQGRVERDTDTDRAELLTKLAGLRTACMLGDSGSVDEIVGWLAVHTVSGEIDALLDEVKTAAESFDYDIVVEKITEIEAKLK